MVEPLRQAQAYAADGTPTAPEDTATAVREGRGFFQKGARVLAKNPDGQVVSIDAADASLPSYQVLNQAQLKQEALRRDAESLGGMAKTAGEGLVRGGTMGFLGPEQFYDKEGREAAKARQQYNPGISGGSEVAGALGATIAASALTGGAGTGSAAGRLAALAGRGALTPFRAAAALGEAAEAATGASTLGRIAGMGLRGAAEGALFGAGHEVSQAALEDVPLTAERLLAGAWDGTKMGGAFGLGLGVLGQSVGKAGRAIVGRMSNSGDDLTKATGTWAENAAFKQNVGNQGKIFDQATKFGRDEAGPARIGRKLLDANISTKDKVALQQVEQLRRDALARMQSVVRSVDEAGVATNPQAILATIDDQIAKLKETPFGDAQALAERMERQIAPFRARYAATVKATEGVIGGPTPATREPVAYNYDAPVRSFDELMGEVEKSVTKAEREAIHDYTTTSYAQMNEVARNTNDALKRIGPTGTTRAQVKNARLQSLLEREVADGRAYRGEVERVMDLPDSVIKEWLETRAVTNNSLWSTTADPVEFAKTIAKSKKANVRLHISHADAVPVAKFSKVAGEKEAIIPAGRTFSVLRNEEVDGVKHIWLEQVHESEAAFANRLLRGAATDGATPAAAAGAAVASPPSALKLSELWELRKSLDESINFEAAQRGPAKEALMDMRAAFVAELDDTIARAAESSGMDSGLLGAWKKATEDYGDMALAERGLKGLIKQRSKNRAISPSDYAAGMLMALLTGGNPVAGIAAGAASSGVHQLLRERGLGVMARIADRTGGVAAQMETAGKVAALVESPKRLVAPVAVNTNKLFERYSEAIAQVQTDPVKFSEKMAEATADLSLRAPELAQQVQRTMLADMAYLEKLHPAPASRKGTTLTPLAKMPEFYAYNQKQAFVDAAMALDNPMGVFEDIARGELPLTKIETLKERRPLLFSEMRQTVIRYTATRQEELPFSRRMLLGTAFSFPADWSMTNVAAIQEALVAGNASGKPNDPTAAPSKVGTDPGAGISPGQF